MAGLKNDKGKPMITLVRPEFVRGVAQVMTFGAKKYGKYNYREGIEYSRVLDAVFRHLLEVVEGRDVDPESGLLHIYHAAAGLNMLADFMENKLGTDDRTRILVNPAAVEDVETAPEGLWIPI